MASPFKLKKEKSAGQAEYAKTLAKEMKRYRGDRDKAVRSANVASGYGSSTAERFKGGGKKAAPSGGGGAKSGGATHKKRVDPQKTASTGNVPIPTPRPTQFPPDLAVSPPHPADPMAASAPTNAGAGLYRPPMPPPLMGVPPDLRGMPQGGPSPLDMHGGGPPPGMPSPGFGGGPPSMGAPGLSPPPQSPRWGSSSQPLFNSFGMKSEPQDPNEPWWKAALRG